MKSWKLWLTVAVAGVAVAAVAWGAEESNSGKRRAMTDSPATCIANCQARHAQCLQVYDRIYCDSSLSFCLNSCD
jgi:hypothetical protein